MNETDQSVSRENEIKKTPSLLVVFVVAELLSLAAIVAVGWFLIGYYTKAEFLQTGYPDWMYHAFRIRDIQQYGIASWDHVWSNGLNHWRAFQYVEHVLTLLVANIWGFSITHAMLWVSVVVFILIRVFIYAILRFLHVTPLIALLVAIVSYEPSQQWVAVADFSIFVALIIVPLYLWLWIVTLRDKNLKTLYILAACSGASWSVHPVLGYSFTGMLLVLILANNAKRYPWKLTGTVAIFALSLLPFALPYLSSGYIVNNPLSGTRQFLERLLISDGYFGLSRTYFILLGVSWAIFLLKSEESPRWAKLLLFYCTLYLSIIYFGQLGYYPIIINKLQIPRAIPVIAILLSFCFAAFLYTFSIGMRSKMKTTVFLILMAVSISQSIDTASRYSGALVNSMQDAVSLYFSDQDAPQGSIYYKDFIYPSYFEKARLRFVTSYNRFPNPYPVRFNTLMKTDISYTGATDHQINLIDDYSTVLGVEYIFVPKLSPLVPGLTADRGDIQASFEQVGEVELSSEVFSVLRSRRPIANAYVFESDRTAELLRFEDIAKPTLNATSYESWDEEVHRVAELIRSGDLKPIALSFGWPDRLEVDGSSFGSFQHPAVLINQSYDAGWHVENSDDVRIEPTNLRFMYLSTLPGESLPQTIQLKNSWPWWHWPVQALGVLSIVITLIAFGISSIWRRNRSVSSTT